MTNVSCYIYFLTITIQIYVYKEKYIKSEYDIWNRFAWFEKDFQFISALIPLIFSALMFEFPTYLAFDG